MGARRRAAIAAVASLALWSAAAQAQSDPTISVAGEAIAFDEAPDLMVSGLEPGVEALVTVTATDADGQTWWSQNAYHADDAGRIDPAKAAPVRGTYENAHASGPFWSMVGARTFATDGDASVTVTVSHPDGVTVAERAFTWTAPRALPNLAIDTLEVPQLSVTVYRPADAPGPAPAVIVLGGSGGGANAERAALLASHGYAAVDVAYFGVSGTPPYFVETIALERFMAVLDALADDPAVDAARIAVMGRSYGGQLALSLAARDPRVRAVIADVPSAYVTGTPNTYPYGPAASAWSFGGAPLPFHAGDGDPAPDTLIPVEEITGAVLLISGEDDVLWPSSAMSEAMAVRLRAAGQATAVVHLAFPNAGHNFGGGEQSYGVPNLPPKDRRGRSGGTTAGNSIAAVEAWAATLTFLETHLNDAPVE